ncbi:MAG: DEAD/DEAH box helicase [Desulfobacterales bacterium]|nr:DEAD/DEAH box helicase [Desulfobacterales bacterium]
MLNLYDEQLKKIGIIYAHCGLNEYNSNRIYSISAATIDFNEKVDRFNSLINYPIITEREKYYSNIAKDKLASAPDIKKVKKSLGKFLDGIDVLLAFDNLNTISDIENIFSGKRFIDLCFASEFFMPFLEAHSPKRICEYLYNTPRTKISFSSEEMVDISIELIKHICGTILNDRIYPRAQAIRYYLEKTDTLFGTFFITFTSNFNKYFECLLSPCSSSNSSNWKKFLERGKPVQRKKNETKNPYKKISTDYLENLYKNLSDSVQGFKYRPSQIEYAKNIAETLNDNAVLCVEAGTGTGKTQGYLVPVLEFLYRNQEARAVISTYTKSLQEQVFQRELRVTKETFKMYSDIPASILKGKSSYVCAEKLDQMHENELTGINLLIWIYFLNITYNFRTSDIDSIGEKIKFYLNKEFLLSRMQMQVSAKIGCDLRHFSCPSQIIFSEAVASRLIITNHFKLALLSYDQIISELFKIYVIDEANHFEHAIRNAFSIEISSREIENAVDYLYDTSKNMYVRCPALAKKDIEEISSLISELKKEFIILREALTLLDPFKDSSETKELPLESNVYKNKSIKWHISSIVELSEKIVQTFTKNNPNEFWKSLNLQNRTVERIKTSIDVLSENLDSFKLFGKSLESKNEVFSYQLFPKSWNLSCQKVEVSDLIKNNIYDKTDSVVYTAATLTYKKSFDIFKKIVNMFKSEEVKKEFKFNVIPSPFNKNSIEIIVPKDACSGKYEFKEKWLNYILNRIPELIIKNNGSTLVLFSSYQDLQIISGKILEKMQNLTFPILVQQKGNSTINLCDEFRTVKESVLFGVDTFWYGVDFKGDTLTQVIITRIPYPSPGEPIQKARKKLMSSPEYWERYNYETFIKMKQGVGRLIRSDTDKGKVIILDSRYKDN